MEENFAIPYSPDTAQVVSRKKRRGVSAAPFHCHLPFVVRFYNMRKYFTHKSHNMKLCYSLFPTRLLKNDAEIVSTTASWNWGGWCQLPLKNRFVTVSSIFKLIFWFTVWRPLKVFKHQSYSVEVDSKLEAAGFHENESVNLYLFVFMWLQVNVPISGLSLADSWSAKNGHVYIHTGTHTHTPDACQFCEL